MNADRRDALLATLAAVGLAILATAYTSLNTDLGWILDYGRQATALGHLPTTNARSFIEPNHPLVLHEWAACLFFYFIHAHWGAAGLILMRWLCIAATLTIVGHTIRRTTSAPVTCLAVLLIAAQTLAGGLQLLRPQLASIVLLAAVVHLGLYGTRRSIWWTVLLFALWANLHGGWLAGLVVLTACSVGRLIEERSHPSRLLVPLLCALALLANPWGWQLIVHTLHHAGDDVRLMNQEWRPLLHAGDLAPFEKHALACFAGALVLAAFTVSPRRITLWALLLLGIAAGVSANRNLRIAPILILPAVSAGLGRLESLMRRNLQRFVPVLAGLLIVAFSAPLAMAGGRLFRLVDYPTANPGTALWIMQRNHIAGRLWSDFNWGGTILWTLPDVQIGCDGRNVVAYSVPTLRASMLFGDVRDPVGLLERYGAELVLLSRDYPHLSEIAAAWPTIYCDDQVCLFSRNPEHQRQAKAGLTLPARPVLASELFDPPHPDAAIQ